MTSPAIPDLWDLIDSARALKAQKLHLVPGSPPKIRSAGGEMSFLHEDAPPLAAAQIMGMLCRVVDPDRWQQLEDMGEGEVALSGDGGRRLILAVYRSREAWGAVVHL